MNDRDFRRLLLHEQYGTPTPEWHPSLDDRIAAGERVGLLEHDERAEDAA